MYCRKKVFGRKRHKIDKTKYIDNIRIDARKKSPQDIELIM